MSGRGQKLRRTQNEYMFSALPPNPDIARCSRDVSKVPPTDSCTAANSIFIRSPSSAIAISVDGTFTSSLGCLEVFDEVELGTENLQHNPELKAPTGFADRQPAIAKGLSALVSMASLTA
jgi:hypothetical protein